MSLHILSWLAAGIGTKKAAIRRADEEIERKQQAIGDKARDIEAVEPIVDEAVKRTDDVYYKLRSEVKRAERRTTKTKTDLFVQDLERGWRRSDGK